MRTRQIATVVLILGLTVAGFIAARLITEQDARRDSERRADVAAAQIRGRVVQAASLTESLRRFMLDRSGTGITSDQFARNALRWLSPAAVPAAAWVERVPDSQRAAYERRLGQPIVTTDQRRSVGSRSSYVPATLVSGFHPLALPGTDLSREPGMGAALTRASRLDRVAATRPTGRRTATNGLFLVAPAPLLVENVLRPGYVVVFVSDPTLRAAATDTPVQITAAGASTEVPGGGDTVSTTFSAAGQRFDVVVPLESVQGAASVLPWIIVAAGLVLAALAAALEVNSARRERTQEELDRIFRQSSDLIAVADFNGYFTRVNPAAERILGYSEEEIVARPYLEFVHPDDREQTAAEAGTADSGRATVGFENRYVRKDGSHRVLEWTATPVPEEGLVYCVARDVTERRQAEAEVERLADTQAALRRVATLVARGGPAAEVFEAVTHEAGELLGVDAMHMGRYDAGAAVNVAGWSRGEDHVRPGMRVELDGTNVASLVFQSGRPARIDGPSAPAGTTAERLRNRMGVHSSVAVPIVVEGRLWGLMIASSRQSEPLPADTESRLLGFTELAETAIARAEAQAELGASRARLVAAADDERRRVVRDLHDGAQQRLVHTVIMLKLAGAELNDPEGRASELVSQALGHAEAATADLRELSHGILPAVLAHGGLQAGVDALAARMTVPVEVDVPAGRLPKSVEATAYFLVAEALTNVAKHAHAHRATVSASVSDDALRVEVLDDGVGGARIEGSGLVGLRDRVTALHGSFAIDSPRGGGTVVTATIPMDES